MDTLTIISFVLFSGVALAISCKGISALSTFVKLVFFILVALIIATRVNVPSLIWMMTAYVALNVVLSRLSFFRTPVKSLIPILISTGGFVLIQSDATFSHFQDEYGLINKFTIAGVVMTAFLPLIVDVKDKVLANVVKIEIEGAGKAATIILMVTALFLAHFGAGFIGVFFISSILLASFAYSDLKFEGPQLTPLIVVLAGHFSLALNLEIDLLQGDILFGLLLGAFFVFLFSLTYKNGGILLPVISLFLGIGVVIGVVYAGSMHPLMGGLDSALALLIGAAVAGALKEEIFSVLGVSSLTVAILLAAPFQSADELQDSSLDMMVSKEGDGESQDKVNIELTDLSELTGDYQIISDSSSVSFVMGKKGETKGAFRSIEGEFHFEEDMQKVSAEVKLDLDNFTTFNKMRDESLMGDEYLKQDKFPVMSYSARGLNKVEENVYELTGEFNMLGVELEQTVTLMRVKSEEGIWLIGDGEIDRTKYGMTPSATEGNVVKYSYKVLLSSQK